MCSGMCQQRAREKVCGNTFISQSTPSILPLWCRAVGTMSSHALMGNASGHGRNVMEPSIALMGAMRTQRHVAPTARRSKEGLPAQMGSASGPITNAMERSIALMGAMRLFGDVPKTALRLTSDAHMGNASWPLRNAMDTRIALMGAMRPQRHVK